ncbi:ABC transporter permease [Hathewaya histolytica]|uniref:ABC transporter n=1 Tax=Hathewaya histolytica TaxID=1498 RepID=A0A4U9R521_HATHI|nr:ABC transporter permease [Hathewaya histolytica]VTQ85581.1 ABC transporter [Hathewaya histolytica]
MNLINLLKNSLLALKAHKIRVFLTMIGIIIGISSVVTILSIGDGLKYQVTKSVSDTNTNKFTIYFENENPSRNTMYGENFSKNDLNALKSIDGVEKAEKDSGGFGGGDTVMAPASYFDRSNTLFISIYKSGKLNVSYGRSFKESDKGKNFIVLNYKECKNFFEEPKEAIGKAININGSNFEVIGVLKDDKGSFMPLNSTILEESKDAIKQDTNFNMIMIVPRARADKKKIFEEAKKILKQLHPELKGEYKMQDPNEITKVFEQIIDSITMFIACVTGISLFVGGVGVMNIMYVSVSERKREIGIRRAIGAKPKSILLQFLFEAVLVTMIGGLIGVLLGFLLSQIIGLLLPFKPILTFKNFFVATLFSVLTGVIFGIIPANKAAKLPPIKAIYK